MQADNSEFFYMMDLDDEARLRNVFWADARSRATFKEFGDVITFDTTYLTNKYDTPFSPFVGVNHHGQSVLLGCGLISNEDVDTFTWLFQSWFVCMSGCPPNAILTDQDKAMKKAIEIVFSNAQHRWCLWHIMKKLPEKLRGHKEYDSIKFSIHNCVYDSLSIEEFEHNWCKLIGKYNLEGSEWLLGLYEERHRWVPTFLKDTFWVGMSTTQRSESMNAFFDGYVNSKTTLKQFVEQYENTLRSKMEKENQEDFNSCNSWLPCITHYDMEKQFQSGYTTTKLKEFQKELTGKIYCDLSPCKECFGIAEYEVGEDVYFGESLRCAIFKVWFNMDGNEINCNCRLFQFRGILCRHAITVLIHKRIYRIPEKYILRRWSKNVKRSHTKINISYDDWSVKPEARRFDKLCKAFYKVADFAIEYDDRCEKVMSFFDELKKDWAIDTCKSIQLSTEKINDSPPRGDDVLRRKESSDVLTPLAVRSKRRPPIKRRQSNVEKVVTKKNKRKKNMEVASTQDCQMQQWQHFGGWSHDFQLSQRIDKPYMLQGFGHLNIQQSFVHPNMSSLPNYDQD